ncbi:MAG: thioredoxin [Thermotogae bacterium]|nr:MAG: thioredoxin [Thermotogota bacterium]
MIIIAVKLIRKVIEVKEVSFNELQSEIEKELVLVEFSTPTCGVCTTVKRKLEAIEENYPQWKFLYIDINKNPEASGAFTVFTAPTIIIFHDGKELNRWARNFGMNQITDYMGRIMEMLRTRV